MNQSLKLHILWLMRLTGFIIMPLLLTPEITFCCSQGRGRGLPKISQANELIWMLTDPERFRGELGKILYNQFGDIITWGQHDIRVDEEAMFIICLIMDEVETIDRTFPEE